MTATMTAFVIGFLIWPVIFIAVWGMHKLMDSCYTREKHDE